MRIFSLCCVFQTLDFLLRKYSLLRKSRAEDHFSTRREKKSKVFLFQSCLLTFFWRKNDLQFLFFKGWCYANDHFRRATFDEKSSDDQRHHNFGKTFVWYIFLENSLIWKRFLGNHTWFCYSRNKGFLRYLFSFTSVASCSLKEIFHWLEKRKSKKIRESIGVHKTRKNI